MAVDDAKQIQAVGATITTSATSANAAIPNTSSGTRPNYVRVQSNAFAYIKFGIGVGTTATANDILLSPNEPEVFIVSANTYIAAIQDAAAGKVNVTALENV